MSQEERWNQQYTAFMEYMKKNKKRPSKYYLEDRKLFNWYKGVKKQLAKGLLSESRIKQFNILLEEAEKVRRKNQYCYVEREEE